MGFLLDQNVLCNENVDLGLGLTLDIKGYRGKNYCKNRMYHAKRSYSQQDVSRYLKTLS